MKRQIIKIDEILCDGCGQCIPNCHEGALQIVDGKARLVSDLRCDGLGACVGHCPKDAITLEEREAEPYNELIVIQEMAQKGKNTLVAHLQHLKAHGEKAYLNQGINYLLDHEDNFDFSVDAVVNEVHGINNEDDLPGVEKLFAGQGCPGMASMQFKDKGYDQKNPVANEMPSALSHWPIQLHLINPGAQHFNNADLVVAADCAAFAYGDFHQKFLKNRSVVIACPKLDNGQEIYYEKLKQLINNAHVNTITVVVMEVPCCGGLISLVSDAVAVAEKKVPVKMVMISIKGDILREEWI
jgi:Pyruvate/2-oxoacid:ferredoxin oxidoreductase delta subunit